MNAQNIEVIGGFLVHFDILGIRYSWHSPGVEYRTSIASPLPTGSGQLLS